MSAAAALSSFCEVVTGGHFWTLGQHKGPVAPLSSPATTMSLVHSLVQARANTLLTDLAYHAPPRGVVIPRAFSASAI